jgi:hypothetical protein
MASLQDRVFDAIASGDAAKAEAMCRAQRDAITAAFPGWCKVPDELRGDPDALRRYASCLITTAQLFEERLGDPSLLEQLRGGAGGNPLEAWQRELAAAREEMTALRLRRGPPPA